MAEELERPGCTETNEIVIEVSGGMVNDVYSRAPIKVTIIDWDNIKGGDTAGEIRPDAFSEMPKETQKAYADRARF